MTRDIEDFFGVVLSLAGYNVRKSIDARSKNLNFVMIETEGNSPIHDSSLINKTTIKITLYGPAIDPDDSAATSVTHLNLFRKLDTDIGNNIPASNIINDRWNLINCYDNPPQVLGVNNNDYWSSSITLELIG